SSVTFVLIRTPRRPIPTLFPYTPLFRSLGLVSEALEQAISAVRGGQRVTDAEPEGKFQALEKYTRDLTALAKRGKVDPVIGRDRSEEHTSELQSRENLVCRLLPEKQKGS